jgi:hypothetical protein
MNKNISGLNTGINELKKDYQPSTNLKNDENSDLLAESHKFSIGERSTSLSY